MIYPKLEKYRKDHPLDNIIDDPSTRVQIRTSRQQVKELDYQALISQVELKNVDDVLKDDQWISAMHEELQQFERNKVWH